MVTISQKSSAPQAVKSVSQVLMPDRDKGDGCAQQEIAERKARDEIWGNNRVITVGWS